MQSLEDELETARQLAIDDLADAIESIGFECTRCGACCRGLGEEEHTATVFPDEVRELGGNEGGEGDGGEYDWRDVARPMPYGLSETEDGTLEGETFEWAVQTDDCGDCVFYEEDDDGTGACVAHDDRPLICRTYPFSVVLADEASEGSSDGTLAGTSQPMGEAVDSVALPTHGDTGDAGDTGDEGGVVRAHECEGLGREISREDAEDLARSLKERAVRELEEAIAVRDNYTPVAPDAGDVVVHDSEGQKRLDGTPLEE
ncbi:YkgJ family cysteine cluster protein [Natronolimnohabitans sp. A-GB9]|uniref:YkgJ family cysteine cluster protein n=1 Tax=Natronolimnohabitans sp. A-GB9 TaxID=3069757 RepID=UPI0027ADC390|nr:YkgJ family cysteine cluster protein [Natronolimnohabitans sp. A-GB9]MDQ2049312.1 YkgJ family cysteine cluster protein [Natronolimnohabitans sp. A-GB9]